MRFDALAERMFAELFAELFAGVVRARGSLLCGHALEDLPRAEKHSTQQKTPPKRGLLDHA
jgi:hypothetical protein